jgi:hypothetical protein
MHIVAISVLCTLVFWTCVVSTFPKALKLIAVVTDLLLVTKLVT